MADKAKHIDVDDFGNIENTIKKLFPEFSDITSRLPGHLANQAQQHLSLAIKRDKPADDLPGGLKPHQMFLLSRRRQNG